MSNRFVPCVKINQPLQLFAGSGGPFDPVVLETGGLYRKQEEED